MCNANSLTVKNTMLSRRNFLAGAAAPLLSAAPRTRPNIVFIMVDDLRWDALGITGHPFLKTPNIDRLGREGAVFENTFVTTPLCSPSRGSFLTGQYVHTHKVTANGDNTELSKKLVTHAMHLQKSGYETAFVGKWHMGNYSGPKPGWDKWVSFRGQGQYDNPLLNIDGTEQKTEGYMTDLLNKQAVDFVKKERSKPFLLYLPHKSVHGPFTPAARHKSLYSSETIRRAPSAQDTLEGKPMLQRPVEKMPQLKPGMGSGDELIRNQLRCLQSIDDGVGDILKALKEKQQLDNTLFIFTSDNGYLWGEHALGDKRPSYEESIRIPMLARWPGVVKAGTKIPQMALNIDIAPTFLEAAGLQPTKEMQGRSLMPLLAGKSVKWRKSFFCEYFAEPNFPRIPSWQAVRTEEWKYTRYPDLQGADELYNLKADPYEMKNLAGDASAKRTLTKMKAEINRLAKETGA
ncbi:MAG: sulfatase [Acidobacteria bacterium]|nr:sulfatase [Acidobacteriota bacterium]